MTGLTSREFMPAHTQTFRVTTCIVRIRGEMPTQELVKPKALGPEEGIHVRKQRLTFIQFHKFHLHLHQHRLGQSCLAAAQDVQLRPLDVDLYPVHAGR